MRVIAGTARGRKFEAPEGDATRPTPDRVREALFSILYGVIDDARVLDLFAGTGALGFEALSRGAKHAIFVEHDKATALLVRKNAQGLGFADRAEIISSTADKAIDMIAARGDRIDVAFLDPPYDAGLLQPTLHKLAASSALSDTPLIVCEHRSTSSAPQTPSRFVLQETRRYGEVSLSFYAREKGPVP